ncbi:hypothetical protein LEN26_000609 [Aphanomyces euteiches]|nr:hypothetical protein AeMF1_017575 [Aphanomyces euteiches]KAH9163173.1 hypothetical protein LEN26_000609 [Aphanomyces euteiches]KAH9190422.1 hypothetical protein AeNC1_007606 [Aphanomyces euteiches]
MLTRTLAKVSRREAPFKRQFSDKILQHWIRPEVATPLHETRFETLSITPSLADGLANSDPSVLNVRLNRPKKINAFNMQMWEDLETLFERIQETPSIRAVVVRGEGRGFSSGMELQVFAEIQEVLGKVPCEAKKREGLMKVIRRFQHIISAPERCRVPVIAAIHGICWGGAVDFITACDLRVCDNAADFSVKEVDLAIVADIGTLQRLPVLIGEQRAKELSYTGRSFHGAEAEHIGLVLKHHVDAAATFEHAAQLAQTIASKSPVTVRGVKKAINYRRDHSTEDSLHQVEQWNASMLLSEDLIEAYMSMTAKKPPQFKD